MKISHEQFCMFVYIPEILFMWKDNNNNHDMTKTNNLSMDDSYHFTQICFCFHSHNSLVCLQNPLARLTRALTRVKKLCEDGSAA